MTNWLREARIETQGIYPCQILMDGKIFDPHAHFQAWREKQHTWTERKLQRVQEAEGRAKELRKEGYSYPKIADALNKEQLQSPTGRPWTADNIRKLIGGSYIRL